MPRTRYSSLNIAVILRYEILLRSIERYALLSMLCYALGLWQYLSGLNGQLTAIYKEND